MERNFNNEFERFLKDSADQYRLYPSPKVWNGIYTALHTRRKWFGLGIALLLLTGTLVTILMTHSTKEAVINPAKAAALSEQSIAGSSTGIANSKPTAFDVNTNVPNNRTQLNSTEATDNSLEIAAINVPAKIYSPNISELSWLKQNQFYNIFNHPFVNPEMNPESPAEPLDVNITDELTDQDIITNLSPEKTASLSEPLAKSSAFDWTIESVINSFRRTNRRLTLQFNLTPTVSYRKLTENKSFGVPVANAPSTYVPLYDINSVVTHKPDLGLEFGLATRYSLTSNFRVKAGLQFNINRYDIKAFNSNSEVARIDLRGTQGVDSLYAFSTHRNFNGYKSDWLQNFYFEISMPVGIEVNLVGDDKVQFGVAATIQPTYVLGDRAYLLSTDYKNYAQVPWLIRRWNVNTGLETFVAYSTRGVKWQVGPQVRYQVLSSFIDKYPVKENLFDFGLKVGISLTK